MNLKERLQLRAFINLIITIIERLVGIISKVAPKNIPDIKPQPDPDKPHRPRPLKKIIDIIPVPWKDKNE